MKELLSFPCGLQITPNHPIRFEGKWIRPCDHARDKSIRVECAIVYNVVLDHSHILIVNGVECCTWGHNLRGDGIEHTFYGTNAVVHALSELPGFEDGFVTILQRGWQRKYLPKETLHFEFHQLQLQQNIAEKCS